MPSATPRLSCTAVLFDLDGVLVRSGPGVERSWRGWARMHGLDSAAVLRLCHGRRTAETIAAVAPHLDADTEAARLEEAQAADVEGLLSCQGADRLLRQLVDTEAPWAVVTSGGRRLATARLRCAGLPLPDTLVTAEDVHDGKPDPEGYILAASRLRTPPVGCVVVEDARSGVVAAQAAGMRVIGVSGPDLGPPGDVDVLITSLGDIDATFTDNTIHLYDSPRSTSPRAPLGRATRDE